MIVTEDISKNYQNIVVFDGLNLLTAQGEIFGLLNHNGAGSHPPGHH
jgi:ABC-type multidrug transport system ATPase subunit